MATIPVMAQTDYERFWLLAQRAVRAARTHTAGDYHDFDMSSGYTNALKTALQTATAFDTDACVKMLRENRASMENLEQDGYTRGYIAGVDEAIHITQGGKAACPPA